MFLLDPEYLVGRAHGSGGRPSRRQWPAHRRARRLFTLIVRREALFELFDLFRSQSRLLNLDALSSEEDKESVGQSDLSVKGVCVCMCICVRVYVMN